MKTIKIEFQISEYPVTQKQYESLIGTNPSVDKHPNKPVTNVSFEDASKYCEALSKNEGKNYSLPSGGQWTLACGADPKESELAKYAVFDQKGLAEVGTKLPNENGLYDMLGNVWEWTTEKEGTQHVLRGGYWGFNAGICCSSYRNWIDPGYRYWWLGFRTVSRKDMP